MALKQKSFVFLNSCLPDCCHSNIIGALSDLKRVKWVYLGLGKGVSPLFVCKKSIKHILDIIINRSEICPGKWVTIKTEIRQATVLIALQKAYMYEKSRGWPPYFSESERILFRSPPTSQGPKFVWCNYLSRFFVRPFRPLIDAWVPPYKFSIAIWNININMVQRKGF